MSKRPKRARTERRRLDRRVEKLAHATERLAELEPGGAPERALVVGSAAQVRPAAEGQTCLHCSGGLRLDSHDARTVDGRRLRVVGLVCRGCGRRRQLYFRIDEPLLS